jgi:hypothetical protein
MAGDRDFAGADSIFNQPSEANSEVPNMDEYR